MDLYTLAIVLHILGAVIGVGAVTIYNLQLFRAIGDKELGTAFQKSIHFYGKLIQTGLVFLVISGLYFMYSNPILWNSEKILAKLGLVAVLIINGFVVNFIYHPKFASLKSDDWSGKTSTLRKLIVASQPINTISIVSWYAIFFLGAVGRQSWSFAQMAIGYILFYIITYIIISFATKKRFDNQ